MDTVFTLSTERKSVITRITTHTKVKLVPRNDPGLIASASPFDFKNPPQDPVHLASTLFEAMHEADGIGLSACQVGIPYAVFCVGWDRTNRQIFFNPRVVQQSTETIDGIEGCLTYPGLFLDIARPKWIRLAFQHVDGSEKEEMYQGLTARAIMHEMMHLEGKRFTDQVPKVKLLIAQEKVKSNLKKIRRAKKT